MRRLIADLHNDFYTKSLIRQLRFIDYMRFIPVIFLAILLLGCSSTIKNQSLVDKGILALSSSNPFLGTNMFLAEEMERSGYLFKFVKERGGPQAIKIREHTFGTVEVVMYYPYEKESYVAERGGSDEMREWIVRGPYALDRHDYRVLRQILGRDGKEPIFVIYGNNFRFKGESDQLNLAAAEHVLEKDHKFTPTEVFPEVPPVPTPKPKPKVIKRASSTGPTTVAVAATPTASPTPFLPLNVDQQAIAMSQGFAERAPNGDIVHTVRTPSESIKMIASWYTGKKENESEIKSVNKLSDPATLKVGDRIIIPNKLATNYKTMSSDFFVD